MGAIAAKGDESALKLFRDILLASSSIPGFFQPVAIDVEANGKTFQEMHLDGTVTAAVLRGPRGHACGRQCHATDKTGLCDY